MTSNDAALDVVDLLRELVRRPTVSGDPRPQRDVMGLVTEVLTAHAPHLQRRDGPDDDQPWTLLTTPTDPQRPRLLFACHVDTVPAADAVHWQRDPFGADAEDGRVWGRGGSDMKAGLVAAVAALAAADPEVPVGLLLTSDEEIGSQGAQVAARALAGTRVGSGGKAEGRAGAVVVPEATGNEVVLGHRGALWLAVRAAGRAAHGSTPHLGHNAVLDLVAVLARAGAELPLASEDFLGTETWNPGVIAGGTVPNVVPDAAEVVVDMRTVRDGAALQAWWRAQPEVAEVEVRVDLPPLLTSADDPWVRALPATVRTEPATYFTDGSVLGPVAGDAPIVVWGPGTPAVMHARDEYVEVAELEQAVRVFGEVVSRWR